MFWVDNLWPQKRIGSTSACQCLPVPCFTLASHVVCVSINLLNNLVDKNCYCFFHAKPLLNCNFDACICQMRMFYSRNAVLIHKLCTQKEFIVLKKGVDMDWTHPVSTCAN